MNLSWSATSDDSTPIAVAREVANPSNYRIVYLNPPPEDDDMGAMGGPDGPVFSNARAYVSSAAPMPLHGSRASATAPHSAFGAAKLMLPSSKWEFQPLPPPPAEAPSGTGSSSRPAGHSRVVVPSAADEPEPGARTKREVIVVTGPSGSGKSHWIRAYTRNYKKLHPDNEVYLISSLGKDDTLDEVKEIKRIDLDKLVANPPKDVKTWTNALVIVDDVEGLEAAKGAVVQRVQDMIASEGRHSGTTLIRASHLSTDYKRTRLLLQEAHALVLFPQAGAHSQYTYLLTKYGGMDKKVVANLLATPTRWLMVHHTAPRYVMTSNCIYLLS